MGGQRSQAKAHTGMLWSFPAHLLAAACCVLLRPQRAERSATCPARCAADLAAFKDYQPGAAAAPKAAPAAAEEKPAAAAAAGGGGSFPAHNVLAMPALSPTMTQGGCSAALASCCACCAVASALAQARIVSQAPGCTGAQTIVPVPPQATSCRGGRRRVMRWRPVMCLLRWRPTRCGVHAARWTRQRVCSTAGCHDQA